MSLLKRLFGGGSAPRQEPETYEGFLIYAEPIKESDGYRVAARIEKEIDGEVQSHHLIRADLCNSETEAREISVLKARVMIDQSGDRLFD